jgi:hypothetical protein
MMFDPRVPPAIQAYTVGGDIGVRYATGSASDEAFTGGP